MVGGALFINYFKFMYFFFFFLTFPFLPADIGRDIFFFSRNWISHLFVYLLVYLFIFILYTLVPPYAPFPIGGDVITRYETL